MLTLDDALEAHWREFGDFLRTKREAARMSSTEAAKAADMTLTQWSRIETGASGTKRGTIPRLANAIGADMRELYEKAGFVPPNSHDLETSFPAGLPPLMQESMDKVIEYAHLLYLKEKMEAGK